MDDTDTGGQTESLAPQPGFTPSHLELAEMLSVTSRKSTRDSLQADIEAFLARGGKIQQVETGMSAEKDMQ